MVEAEDTAEEEVEASRCDSPVMKTKAAKVVVGTKIVTVHTLAVVEAEEIDLRIEITDRRNGKTTRTILTSAHHRSLLLILVETTSSRGTSWPVEKSRCFPKDLQIEMLEV